MSLQLSCSMARRSATLSTLELLLSEFLDELQRLVDPFFPPLWSTAPLSLLAMCISRRRFGSRGSLRLALSPFYDGPYRVIARSPALSTSPASSCC